MVCCKGEFICVFKSKYTIPVANIGICTSHYAIFFKLYVPEFIQAHYNNSESANSVL